MTDDDHTRGCPGRTYSCECGYDERRDELIARLEAENARLRTALENLKHAGAHEIIHEGRGCTAAYLAAETQATAALAAKSQ